MSNIIEKVDALAKKQKEASKLSAQLGQSLLIASIAPALVFPITKKTKAKLTGGHHAKDRAVSCFLEDVNGDKQYLTLGQYESLSNELEAYPSEWTQGDKL